MKTGPILVLINILDYYFFQNLIHRQKSLTTIIHESASTKSGEHQIYLSAFRLLQLRITAYCKFVFAHCFSFNFPFK